MLADSITYGKDGFVMPVWQNVAHCRQRNWNQSIKRCHHRLLSSPALLSRRQQFHLQLKLKNSSHSSILHRKLHRQDQLRILTRSSRLSASFFSQIRQLLQPQRSAIHSTYLRTRPARSKQEIPWHLHNHGHHHDCELHLHHDDSKLTGSVETGITQIRHGYGNS